MTTWIPVLVRAQHVEAVSRFIVELETATDSDIQAIPASLDISETPSAQSPSDRLTWSRDDLIRLAKGSTATTDRWRRAMDVCVENPGAFLPTAEIASRSGMTLAEWRDAPRKISRHLKAHFPNVPRDSNNDPIWPLIAKTVPEYPGQVSWAMTPETAQIWKEIRA